MLISHGPWPALCNARFQNTKALHESLNTHDCQQFMKTFASGLLLGAAFFDRGLLQIVWAWGIEFVSTAVCCWFKPLLEAEWLFGRKKQVIVRRFSCPVTVSLDFSSGGRLGCTTAGRWGCIVAAIRMRLFLWDHKMKTSNKTIITASQAAFTWF